MFELLCFLLSTNMYFGVVGENRMVRVGQGSYGRCLSLPHARKMDFTGCPMKGLVYVLTEGFESDEDL